MLCLRSFHDRGHQVEVFSYDQSLSLPGWIERRNAAEVLPRQHVIRHLEQQDRFAIHASLFCYALLYQRGGWWIDTQSTLNVGRNSSIVKAARLRPLGVRLVLAAKDVRAAGRLQSDGIEVIQAPLWPSASMSAADVARTSSGTSRPSAAP